MGKTIKSIINDIKCEKNEIVRIKYIPYSETISKNVWLGIAKSKIKEIQLTEGIISVWSELIKYVHGDDSCKYDIKKSICLIGMTGSGKTETMKIINDYISIDDVKFIRNGKKVPLKFNMYTSREIVADYVSNGYDGIAKYCIYSNICIDDFGAENRDSNYYGSKLDVLTEIIETRYTKGLTTHFTSNLNLELIKEKYNDRVFSRISKQCNIIILNDKDFRIK